MELDLKTYKMEMTPFTILDNMYGQNTRCVTDQLRVSRGSPDLLLRQLFEPVVSYGGRSEN